MRTGVLANVTDAEVSDVRTGAILEVPTAGVRDVGLSFARRLKESLNVGWQRRRKAGVALHQRECSDVAQEERLIGHFGPNRDARRGGNARYDATDSVVASVLLRVRSLRRSLSQNAYPAKE